MSRHTTHECDRCAQTVTVPNTARSKGRQPAGWARIVDTATQERVAVDLCPRCAGGHRQWLGLPSDDDDETANMFDTPQVPAK